jgi:hypothetical protein
VSRPGEAQRPPRRGHDQLCSVRLDSLFLQDGSEADGRRRPERRVLGTIVLVYPAGDHPQWPQTSPVADVTAPPLSDHRVNARRGVEAGGARLSHAHRMARRTVSARRCHIAQWIWSR